MLLINRIFISKWLTALKKRSSAPSFLSNHINLYSTSSQNRRIKQLHDRLLIDYKKLAPKVVIKTMHLVHFKSQEKDQESLFNEKEIQDIVNNLSSFVYMLGHCQLTLLLEIISEVPKYQVYHRNNQFLRLLVKRLSAINMIQYENEYTFRLLNMLQKMQFPHSMITKYVNAYVTKIKNKQIKINKYSQENLLRFFICVLENKYVPIGNVKDIYRNDVKNMNVGQPKLLCYLYYIYRTLENSVKRKVSYFENKITLNDLIYNPYSNRSSPTQPKQINEQKPLSSPPSSPPSQPSPPPPSQPSSSDNQLKAQIKKQGQQFITEVLKKVDINKLKDQICKHYGFEKYPMQIGIALFINDIEQLKPELIQLFKKNYKAMQPYQFVRFISLIQFQHRESYYQQYIKVIWKLLQIFDKLTLISCRNEYCRIKVSKQEILLIIIDGKRSLSSKEFQLLTSIITKCLTEDQQLEVLKQVEKLTDQGNLGNSGENSL